MKKNSIMIIAYCIMALFVGGIIFAAIKLMSAGDNKPKANKNTIVSLDIEQKKQMYNKKINAYNDQIHDSIIHVRNENVKVDLKQLWSNKVKKNTTSEIREEIAKVTEPVIAKPKGTITKPKVIFQTDTVYIKEETAPVYQRKSSFNSSFNNNSSAVEINNEFMYLVVHERKKVTSGSVVKLRLTKDYNYNGTIIPAGTFINGVAQLANERVILRFASFAYNLLYFDLKNFTAYDPDGFQGVHVPDLVINRAAKDAVGQTTAETRVNIPIIGNVALNTARNENNISYATLAQDYPVILKKN
jgi:Conjugative transposon, TraM